MKISELHFRRLLRRYREKGDAGLVSGHRGKPSSNRMGEEKQQSILDLMLTTYQDFGPTLVSEKLAERDRIQVSKETLRQILIEKRLHRAKTKVKGAAHPLRERRACRGELVQVDGSYHAWLEDRAEEACLLMFVDDAIKTGLSRASKTLENVRSVWISSQEVLLNEKGDITEYRVLMKITFVLKD